MDCLTVTVSPQVRQKSQISMGNTKLHKDHGFGCGSHFQVMDDEVGFYGKMVDLTPDDLYGVLE